MPPSGRHPRASGSRSGRLPALAKPFTVDALRESVGRLLGERGHAG